MTDSRDIEVAGSAVRAFRDDLIDAGYTVANSAGELCHGDAMVATCYSGGEYEIAYWHKRGPRTTIRVNARLLDHHPGYVGALARALISGSVGGGQQLPYAGPGLRGEL